MECRIHAYMTFREWVLFRCSRLLIQELPKQSKYRIFSIWKEACFSHSKFSDIRVRLTFDGIKESMTKCYTVWPKCKAHLHIYNTSHETGNPEIATRDIKTSLRVVRYKAPNRDLGLQIPSSFNTT
jgi:hypothetical protein